MALAVSSLLEFVGRTGNRSHKLLISTYKWKARLQMHRVFCYSFKIPSPGRGVLVVRWQGGVSQICNN
ncbi:MAG: hypothetical protein JWQ34_490 [Mucilaginibacter sp.]|nr:hypothetical protein [Mucilaginibacter sp.]